MSRPSISTATGDAGTTGLFGGQRVSKSDVRLHAYGTIDELNSLLGVVLAEPGLSDNLRQELAEVQSILFTVGADLATPFDSRSQVDRLPEEAVKALEKQSVALEEELPDLTHFILPGGSRSGALLHQARTVCRRAERWLIALNEQDKINEQVRVYVNRLSDYLFLAARQANKEQDVPETQWVSSPEESPKSSD